MIVIAVLALVIFHPGSSFQGHFNAINEKPQYTSIYNPNGEEGVMLVPTSELGKVSHNRYSSA